VYLLCKDGCLTFREQTKLRVFAFIVKRFRVFVRRFIRILMDVIKTNSIPAIREAIDAIGFICFYNKIHSNTQIIDALILCLGNNFNDNIILWKLVRAFEGFNDINVIKTLMEIEQNDSQLVIRNEAKRSMKIINNRTNN
ncbi:hypothetical protein AAHB54_14530, partial [Bacillus cereus]